jgi:hypothetical protein
MSSDTWTYTAHVEGVDSTSRLSYKWTVSQGKINRGQGTSTITIDRPDLQKGIIVVVEVSGFPEGCRNTASVSTIS